MKVTWKREPPNDTLWLYNDQGGNDMAGMYEISLVKEIERLRAAMTDCIEMTDNCAGVPTNPDSLPQMVKEHLNAALEPTK